MSNDKQTHGSIGEVMENFLHEVELTKEASNLDLASDAKSTHPSANVDDGTQNATEGARSSENEADVKKDVPDTINDESSKNEAGGSKKPTDTQGTVTQGSDDGLQGNVDTPKKDHSNSMSDSGPGDDTFDGNWDKASADLSRMGNEITASIAMLLKSASEAEAAPKAEPKVETPAEGTKEASDEGTKEASDEVALYKQAAEQYPDAAEAGYAAAVLLAEQLGYGAEKSAADETQMAEVVGGIRKEASNDADMYINFLRGYEETLQKQAMDPAMMAAAAGGMPEGAEAGAEMGAPGAEELAALGAEGGEGMEGEGDEEAQLEEIAAALDEAGVTPEELAAAVAEAQGGEVPEAEVAEEGGDAEDLGDEGSAEELPEEAGAMEVPASAGKGRVKQASSNKAHLLAQLKRWM